MECNSHGPIDIWARSHSDDHLSHPQIPSPDLSVMYNTHNHPSPSGTATHMSSPTAMPTSAEPSPFPSPVDSVLSPYFAEPATPASVSSEPARSKQSHSRKRPPGHIPRPRNAFILFRSHYVAAQLIPGKVENDHRHISKIIGEIWNKLSPTERLIWEQRADVEKERHSRMYPGYRYKPAKLEGVVKRRVKCRGIPAMSPAYSSTPGIGSAKGPREIVGGLNVVEGGQLRFVDNGKAAFINQEERRRDKVRCARVAELVQQGVVGKQLEDEAQRLGLDRESVGAPTPQLEPSANGPPGMRGHFHTNADILRALEDDAPVFTNPFAPNCPEIPPQNDVLALDSPVAGTTLASDFSPAPIHTSPITPASEHPNVATTAPASVTCEIEKAHRGWPHRRASSLPLTTSLPKSQEFHTLSRSIIPQFQQPGTAPASPMPFRPTSSSPLRRHRRLYYPYLRKEVAQNTRADDNPDLTAFDHVSYHSPASSPPEYYRSPDTFPKLQLEVTIGHHAYNNSASPSNNTSPLYGISAVGTDSDTGRHSHEPIDLSAMYNEQGIANGHGSTLHSTYATNAGKNYSLSAAPAPLNAAHGSQPLSLAGEPVHHQGSGPELGIGPGPGPTYNYDWQTSYGMESSGYGPPDQHDPRAGTAAPYDGVPHEYYANASGDSSY